MHSTTGNLKTGQFQIVTVVTGEAISIPPLSGYTVTKSDWAPDGQRLAYIEAVYKKPAYQGAIGSFSQPHLSVVNADGSDNQIIDYLQDSTGNAMSIGTFTWDSKGEKLVAIAEPVQCLGSAECQRHVILADNNNQVNELFSSKELVTQPLYWSPDNKQLAFVCFSSELERGGLCVADLLAQ